MKTKEKYYVVNNQEDEDGYTLYPGLVIVNENVKRKQDKSLHNTTAKLPKDKRSNRPFVVQTR